MRMASTIFRPVVFKNHTVFLPVVAGSGQAEKTLCRYGEPFGDVHDDSCLG